MPTDKIIESHQRSAAGVEPQKGEDRGAKTEDQILAEKGFYWREKNGVRVLACRALEEKGFVNGFSTRGGGVSPMPENDLNLSGFDDDTEENILENRRRFLTVFGGDFTLATAWQVHGIGVKTVGNLDDARD
ncbi:MAG TPA: laccase domain-containing protein, partial [Pyrinomonadaceae bacterium]|nr:laccase domain-containing protein [Pyrinomonadaceae bacterium]